MVLFNWKNVNIQGMGFVTGLVIDGNRNSGYPVYARTDAGGIYKFNRKTRKWVRFFDNFPYFELGEQGFDSIAMESSPPFSSTKKVYAVSPRFFSVNVNNGQTTYYAEVWQSTDGKGWSPTGLLNSQVLVEPNNQYYRDRVGERLAVDPNKPDNLYYGSLYDGLWRKQGSGNWTRISGANGLPDHTTLSNSAGFVFVAFDRKSGSYGSNTPIVYAGVNNSGIYKSVNGGATWTKMANPNSADPANDSINRGYVSPVDGTFYCVSGATWVSKISRNGSSWTTCTPQPAYLRVVNALDLHPTNANIVVACEEDKYINVSTNGGTTWDTKRIYTGAFDANYPTETVNPTAPGYYQAYSGSYACCIKIDPQAPNKRLWWSNGWGVARIEDYLSATPTFIWEMDGFEELDSNICKCPPKPFASGGAQLITGVQDMIGFRHTNVDVIPAKINPVGIAVNPDYSYANDVAWGGTYPVPFPHVAGFSAIDYCEKQPDYLAGVGFHQWQQVPIHGKSSDNGQTWQAFPSLPVQNYWDTDISGLAPRTVFSGVIAINSNNPLNMVWSPQTISPHYTTDGGVTWNQCKLNNPGTAPNPIDPTNEGSLYWDNLPRNFANSQSPWAAFPNILIADKNIAGTFYYWDCFKFYRSQDNGATWDQYQTIIPNFSTQAHMVSHPLNAGEIWFANRRADPGPDSFKLLYRSTNGGQTFSIVSSVTSCELVTFGKGAGATPDIYIFGRVGSATQDTMYKSSDLGSTWSQISVPSVQAFPGINYLEGDMRQQNIVYASLGGRGFIYGVPAV